MKIKNLKGTIITALNCAFMIALAKNLVSRLDLTNPMDYTLLFVVVISTTILVMVNLNKIKIGK